MNKYFYLKISDYFDDKIVNSYSDIGDQNEPFCVQL